MSESKEYNMAVALLNFKNSYKKLVAASKQLPNYDCSELYPFYLLDFETIEPAVLQWCTVHASKLIANIPDRVSNPACLQCSFFGDGIGSDGQCVGLARVQCNIYPFISFSRELVTPALIAANFDLAGLSDTEVLLLYLKRIGEVHANKQEITAAIASARSDTDSDTSSTGATV